jgi:hypothetical protein
MLSTYGKTRSLSAAAGILRATTRGPMRWNENARVLLVACRLACSCTLGAYSIQQNPANKYLLLHAEPAWKLELIWCYDPDQRTKMAVRQTDSSTKRVCTMTLDQRS